MTSESKPLLNATEPDENEMEALIRSCLDPAVFSMSRRDAKNEVVRASAQALAIWMKTQPPMEMGGRFFCFMDRSSPDNHEEYAAQDEQWRADVHDGNK